MPLGLPGGQRVAPDLAGLLGHEEDRQPAVGVLGGRLHVLLPQRRDPDGDGRALGLGQQLERLAEPGALALGQGQREDPVVRERLAAQPAADQVDDLPGAAERLVVPDPVEPLDHLRSAGAEAEDRPALRHVVEAGRRLQDRARGARVDVEDRRPDLDRLGLGGQVAHQRGGVEAVRLRHPDPVQARLLEGGHLVGGLARVAGVHQLRRELHPSTVTEPLSRSQGVRS